MYGKYTVYHNNYYIYKVRKKLKITEPEETVWLISI